MKRTLKISLLILFCIWGSGCSKDYERDSSQGEMVNIGLVEFENMMKEEETFSIMLTQSHCGACIEFEGILDTYLQNHKVTMYNVVLDLEPRTREENLDIIDRYFNDFSNTPGIYYVKDGKMESHLNANENGIDEALFDRWVVKYEMDARN